MIWFNIKKPYFYHSKMMASYLGLQVKQLNDARLRERLNKIYEKRNDLSKLKTDTSTYH